MAESRAVRPMVETRPRLVDLNLLPPELRRGTFSSASSLLVLLVLAGILLGVIVLQLRLRADDETSRLTTRLSRAQSSRSTLSAVETQAQEIQGKINTGRQQIDQMQNDYQTVAERRVAWSQIFQQLVASAPTDLGLASIQQKNFQIIVQGTASNYASVTGFADRLNGANLFSEVLIQNINEVPPGSGVPPIDTGPPPSITPAATAIPQPTPTNIVATATAPAAAITVLPPTSPTTRPPPPTPPTGPTPTALPATASPNPGIDYRVGDKIRTSVPGTTDRFSVIRVKILDEAGAPVSGKRVQISSCCPDVKDEKTTGVDGAIEFVADRKADYQVVVVGGKSEVANGLSTNTPGFTGYHIWEVTYRRVNGATTQRPGLQTDLVPASLRPAATDELSVGMLSTPGYARDTSTFDELVLMGFGVWGTDPVAPAKPVAATFSFTMVIKVKPGAGQVPAAATPAPGSSPIAAASPITGTGTITGTTGSGSPPAPAGTPVPGTPRTGYPGPR